MKNVFVSENASPELVRYLKYKKKDIFFVRPAGKVYSAVSAHPDIYMCRDEERGIVIKGNPDTLGRDYPENIIYNAVIMKNYLIHNLRYTAKEILDYGETMGLKRVNVKQGYTKCSCVVVGGDGIITADEGIYRAVKDNTDIDILKIRPGFVSLPGHDIGFLGGTSGRIDVEIIFNGNLSAHPDYYEICDFIGAKGFDIKYFPEYELTDIGSIIEE